MLVSLVIALASIVVASNAHASNSVELKLSDSSNVTVVIHNSSRTERYLDSFNSYSGSEVEVENDIEISSRKGGNASLSNGGGNSIAITGKNLEDVSAVINDSSRRENYVSSFNSHLGESIEVSNEVDVQVGKPKGKSHQQAGDTVTVKGKNMEDVSAVINNSSRTETYVDAFNSYGGSTVDVSNDVDISVGQQSGGQPASLPAEVNSITLKGKNFENVSAVINDSSRTETYINSFNSYDGTTTVVDNEIDISVEKQKGGKKKQQAENSIVIKGKDLHGVIIVVEDNSVTAIYLGSFNSYDATDSVEVENEISVSNDKKGKKE